MEMEIRHGLNQQGLISILKEFGNQFPLQRIIRLVGQFGLTTVCVDREPPDSEYRAEYEAFYKNALATRDKGHPTRLHFFKGDLPDISKIASSQSGYLGYCDIRPTPDHTVSCALIDYGAFAPAGSERHLFVICRKPFKVPFREGVELTVNAFPYIQQDGFITTCAQASLASIAMYFGHQMSGPDFTRIGAEVPVPARQIPSSGLYVEQIVHGVKKMGRDPEVHDWRLAPKGFEESQHREQIIYRYLESKIPIIVGIETKGDFHALVVIGHTFTPDTWQAEGLSGYYLKPKTGWIDDYPAYHCSTNWIERFVIQDDNMGPYTLIPTDLLQYFNCKVVIVPLEQNINLRPETAEMIAGALLCPKFQDIFADFDDRIKDHQSQGNVLDSETAFWFNLTREHVQKEDYVLRTCLRDRASWKSEVTRKISDPKHQEVVDDLYLPDRVWQIEISFPLIFTHWRCCCGEIIIDATTPYYGSVEFLNQCWLYMHVPGVISHRNPKTQVSGSVVLESKDVICEHHFTV